MKDPAQSIAPWNHHWLTITEFARVMGRSERQVLNWTQNGTLSEFGYAVYCVSRGRFHSRFFIQLIP